MKRCRACGKNLDDSEFYADARNTDGIMAVCRACHGERAKSWRRRNPERRKAIEHSYNATYYAANREREQQRAIAFYQDNKPLYRAAKRRRYATDSAPIKAVNNARRARLKIGDTNVTAEAWRQLLEWFDHRCAYCLDKAPGLEMDHVIPLSRGGKHELSNIVPACERCNCSKNDKTLLEIFDPRLLVAQRMLAT